MNVKKVLARSLTLALLIFGSYFFAEAQPDSIYRLPAGTRIRLRLDAEINSRVSGLNDTFTASVSRPVIIRDTVVLPIGTLIEGRVTGVKPASAGCRAGKLDLAFETLKLASDQRRNIDGRLVNNLRAGSSQSVNLISILGGTVIGAIFGGVSRSGGGALIGAGIGAGVGTGVALARKGKDVRIRKDTDFEIELRRDVVLPVIDY